MHLFTVGGTRDWKRTTAGTPITCLVGRGAFPQNLERDGSIAWKNATKVRKMFFYHFSDATIQKEKKLIYQFLYHL